MVKIEYVCLRNIVRSPIFESVTKNYLGSLRIIHENIEIVSSGLDYERLNNNEFNENEIIFYLSIFYKNREYFPNHQSLLEEALNALNETKLNNDLAGRVMSVIEEKCIEIRDSIIKKLMLPYPSHPKQFNQKSDSDLIVCLSRDYLPRIVNKEGRIVRAINEYGVSEPPSIGFRKEYFECIFDIAKESAPKIITDALTMMKSW